MCRQISSVALFDGANREDTIYRSKAVGEPPLMLAISVFAAIADAIHSLRPGQAGAARRAGDAGIDLARRAGGDAALNLMIRSGRPSSASSPSTARRRW